MPRLALSLLMTVLGATLPVTKGLVTNYCILVTALVRKPYDDINSIDTCIAAAANRHQTEQKSRSYQISRSFISY